MNGKLFQTCPLISHGSAVPASPQGEAFRAVLTTYRPDVGRVLAPAVPCWQICECYRKRYADVRK